MPLNAGRDFSIGETEQILIVSLLKGEREMSSVLPNGSVLPKGSETCRTGTIFR